MKLVILSSDSSYSVEYPPRIAPSTITTTKFLPELDLRAFHPEAVRTLIQILKRKENTSLNQIQGEAPKLYELVRLMCYINFKEDALLYATAYFNCVISSSNALQMLKLLDIPNLERVLPGTFKRLANFLSHRKDLISSRQTDDYCHLVGIKQNRAWPRARYDTNHLVGGHFQSYVSHLVYKDFVIFNRDNQCFDGWFDMILGAEISSLMEMTTDLRTDVGVYCTSPCGMYITGVERNGTNCRAVKIYSHVDRDRLKIRFYKTVISSSTFFSATILHRTCAVCMKDKLVVFQSHTLHHLIVPLDGSSWTWFDEIPFTVPLKFQLVVHDEKIWMAYLSPSGIHRLLSSNGTQLEVLDAPQALFDIKGQELLGVEKHECVHRGKMVVRLTFRRVIQKNNTLSYSNEAPLVCHTLSRNDIQEDLLLYCRKSGLLLKSGPSDISRGTLYLGDLI